MSNTEFQLLDWQPIAMRCIEFDQNKTQLFPLPRRVGKTTFLARVREAGTAAGCTKIVALCAENYDGELAGADLLLIDDLEKLPDKALAKVKALCGTIPIVAVLTPLDRAMKWKEGEFALPPEHLQEHFIKCFRGSLN